MKLSKTTVQLLKNFASINGNFYVNKGNEISTLAEAKNIVASANIEESFPSRFGVYDLSQFLSALALIDDPDIDVNEDHCVISSGRTRVRFRFADESILTHLEKPVNFPDLVVEVTLTEDDINKLRSAASALGNAVLSIKSSHEGIVAVVIDPADPSASSFTMIIDTVVPADTFDFRLSMGNLKLLPGDYDVAFAKERICRWSHQKCDLVYAIATEKSSTYTEAE